MKTKSVLVIILLSIFISLNNAQVMERKDITEKYKWNLADLYPDVQSWHKAKENISANLGNISKYQGKLGESAENLHYTLANYYNIVKDFWKLSIYANRIKDEDVRVAENDALAQEAASLGTRLGEVSAFINPEILKIDPSKIEKFYINKIELREFETAIKDIQRLRDHTLTESEEQILASFGQVTGTMANVYGTLNNAELPYAKVVLSDAGEVELNNSNFVRFRTTENRADREKIFNAFFNKYGEFKNTIGLNLAGKVRSDWVYAKNRKYSSSLESSLDNFAIPTSVYETLINQINENLPTLHRFLKLKAKMLGVDNLHYYDLYTPIVDEVKMEFTVEEGQNVILEGLKSMGGEYIGTVKKSFDERWIDFLPNAGKRSGAYSSGGAYDVHPYILMNWTDDWESVSTLAHELGHTMHSYFSNKHQPFQYAGYSTFVAEIASTCNEAILIDYMLKKVKSDKEKMFLLGSYLEGLRTTIFRQVSFAEFEWEIHKKVENGEPLNGDIMSRIYENIVKKYYGHNEGICVVDDEIKYEWAYIPHFIGYNYYVYQYATSLIYATAFAEKILSEGQPAIDKYYEILKGGSSDYPIELIKKAGLDPMSSEAFNLTINKMNRVMDQIEELLNK